MESNEQRIDNKLKNEKLIAFRFQFLIFHSRFDCIGF